MKQISHWLKFEIRVAPIIVSVIGIGQYSMQNKLKLKPERELYAKFMDGQKVEIAKRAVEHRIASTIRHFTMKYPHLNKGKQHSHVVEHLPQHSSSPTAVSHTSL